MVLLPRGISPGFAGLAVLLALLTAWDLSRDVVRGTLRERAFDLVLPLLPRPAYSGPGVVIVDIDRRYVGTVRHVAVAAGTACRGGGGRGGWQTGGDRAGHVAGRAGPVFGGRRCGPGSGAVGCAIGTWASCWRLPIRARTCRPRPSCRAHLCRCRACGAPMGSSHHCRCSPMPHVGLAHWWLLPTPMARSAACRCWSWRAASCGQAWPSSWYGSAQGAAALLIEPGGMLHVGDIALPLGDDATLRLFGSPAIRSIPALRRWSTNPATRAMLAGQRRAHRQQRARTWRAARHPWFTGHTVCVDPGRGS